ncbi:MAG: hypothetical protein EBV07_00590 [Proteobacteria bacterium]|nr:hypothetical protein [Pseudomonadota bacterium]
MKEGVKVKNGVVSFGPRSITFKDGNGWISFCATGDNVNVTYVKGAHKGSEKVISLDKSSDLMKIEKAHIRVKKGLVKITFVVDTTTHIINIQQN